MKLHFSIPYRAQWGEDVCVELILRGSRSREVPVLLRMETTDGYLWQADYRVMESGILQFSYTYVVCCGEEVVRREWARVPRLFEADANRTFLLNDFWMETPPQPWLFDPAFNESALRSAESDLHTPAFAETILLRVLAHTLAPGEAVAILGSQPPLGDWHPQRALLLKPTGMCEWRLSVSATALQMPFEYKFVIVDASTGELLRWEVGDNRVCDSAGSYSGEVKADEAPVRRQRRELTTVVRNDGLVRLPELFPQYAPAVATKSAEVEATEAEGPAAVAVGSKPTSSRAPLADVTQLQEMIDMAEELGLATVGLDTLRDVVSRIF